MDANENLSEGCLLGNIDNDDNHDTYFSETQKDSISLQKIKINGQGLSHADGRAWRFDLPNGGAMI